MKKTIIIIGIFLGVLSLVAGVYFAWKKSKEILNPPTLTQTSTTTYNLPQTTGGASLLAAKLQILSDQPVFDYWVMTSSTTTSSSSAITTSSTIISSSTIDVFYFNQKGELLKVQEGQDELLGVEAIENIESIKVTGDGSKVLVKSGSQSSSTFAIFNVQNKMWQPLPETVVAADFSPDGTQIVYLDNAGNLTIKDLIGAKPKTTKVLAINETDFDLKWISSQKIILTPPPSAFYQSTVWLIDVKNKTLAPMGLEKYGLMFNWSKSGQAGLMFSSQNGRDNSLSLINGSGEMTGVLDFITLPDKCTINEPEIYCAIPKEILSKTILPDDYLKRDVYFDDAIYQFDIDKNTTSEVFGGSNPNIDAMHLSLVGNQLFFINRYDDRVYDLEL